MELLIWFASALAVYLLRPKPKQPNIPVAGKVDVPKTQEGDEIGKVFGTVWITDPQVVWYGDFRSEEITSNAGKK